MTSPSGRPAGRPFARGVFGVLALAAALSVTLVVVQIALHLRNIPYWDEFDVVLRKLPQLDPSLPWPDAPDRLFALQNEHRIFTSNLLFATLQRTLGSVNFIAIAVIGNLFLLGLCAVLIERAGDRMRATRLAIVLGLLVIHLQHHGNLFWSGSSIDHFHVVLLAVVSFAALTDGSRRGLLGAVLFALLGSYTLTHGFVIWPVGAALLAAARRWRALAVWCGVAVYAVACFLPGFFTNPAHHVEASFDVARILVYWLALLGSTPAIGHLPLAPWLGAGLLASVLWLARRGGWRAAPLPAAATAFCLLSLGMIALGRTGVTGGIMLPSRYAILSALPWALVAWLALEQELARTTVRWPRIALAGVAGVAVNVALNVRFFPEGARFAQQREEAAAWFHYHGTLADAPFRLFPHAADADHLLRRAAAIGLYRLPLHPAKRVDFDDARPTGDITYFFDEVRADADRVYLRGWAFVRGRKARLDQLHLLFQAGSDRHVLTVQGIRRPDVAAAFHDPNVADCGFLVAVPRAQLPDGTSAVGVLFQRDDAPAEFIMTDHRVTPAAPDNQLLTRR